MPNVEDYIDAATRRPFLYGGGADGWRGHDCTLFLANWVNSFGNGDPGIHRGTYSTKSEAEAIIAKARGLVPLIGCALVNVGWSGKADPSDGDVAVVSYPAAPGVHIDVPVLRWRRRWIAADPRQLVPLPGNLFCRLIWGAP